MSPLDILTAARDRARYTWEPGSSDEGKSVIGIMRAVALDDYKAGSSSWEDAWEELFSALPADVRDSALNGPAAFDVFADDMVDGWTSRADRTLSEVMALFDIAIRAAS